MYNQLHVHFFMMLLKIFTIETSFRQVYIDSVHFCNCIFFNSMFSPLNSEMKPFNLKNTITEMYTCWKLISMIYLNCWIFTCAIPFNSSSRGTVNDNQPHSAAVLPLGISTLPQVYLTEFPRMKLKSPAVTDMTIK